MNEKGFVLPITLAVSLCFLTVMLFLAELYVTKVRFVGEQYAMQQLDSLMQMASTDTLQLLSVNASPQKGNLSYPNGIASYDVKKIDLNTVEATIICTNKDNHMYKTIFRYSLSEKKITLWKDKVA